MCSAIGSDVHMSTHIPYTTGHILSEEGGGIYTLGTGGGTGLEGSGFDS